MKSTPEVPSDRNALPASTTLDNTEATSDIAVPCGVASGPWRNVWYKVTGTGGLLSATTCNAGTVVSDTKISVFCSDCVNLPCVDGNDDDCGAFQIFSSTVTWCSQPGVEYLVTVGNFSDFTVPGVIQLDVVDLGGGPCTPTVNCVPTGACCGSDGVCFITSESDCLAGGGTYFGDGSECDSNGVSDGSFEGGSPSAAWAEFSSNFGTPLCTIASCGTGTGTGPRTGDWWSWFGGIAAAETGSVEQSVVIPVGSNTLDFWLEIPAASGNGFDFLEVRLDGNVELKVDEADGPYVGYALVQVDISAYADGNAHDLEFYSEISGSAVTNFFVDDVSIPAQSIQCRECVTIDFETEDDFATALVNGQDISTPPEFGNLVAISGAGANNGPAIYDTSEFGPNYGGGDPDLLVRTGNALILQGTPGTQTVAGIFDTPCDSENGGTLIFDFQQLVEMQSVNLIDIDRGPGVQDAVVTLIDAAGSTRTYVVPGGWTRDISVDGAPGYETLDLTTLADQPGFQRTATASETAGFDASSVVRMEIFLSSSGGVDEVSFCY